MMVHANHKSLSELRAPLLRGSRLLQLAIGGIAVSVASILIVSLLFGVDLEEITKVGTVPFITASSISILRLLIQGLRFHILARTLAPSLRPSLSESLLVRIGSEFLALTSVAYIGDEFVRAAWLARRGTGSGRALWIAYMEILSDVLVGGVISLAAAGTAALSGETTLSILIVATTSVTLGFYVLITFQTTRKQAIPISQKIFGILHSVGSKKIADALQKVISGFADAANETLKLRPWRAITFTLILTLFMALLAGLAFWVLTKTLAYPVSIFQSILGVYATLSLASLPVTLGGSVITEIGMNTYTTSVLGLNSLATVIAWRISSFHIPLIVTGAALILLLAKEGRHSNR